MSKPKVLSAECCQEHKGMHSGERGREEEVLGEAGRQVGGRKREGEGCEDVRLNRRVAGETRYKTYQSPGNRVTTNRWCRREPSRGERTGNGSGGDR